MEDRERERKSEKAVMRTIASRRVQVRHGDVARELLRRGRGGGVRRESAGRERVRDEEKRVNGACRQGGSGGTLQSVTMR